jgi:SAM-dependent methyltransferase
VTKRPNGRTASSMRRMSNEQWSAPVTVEEMYGDWDWEAAVAAVDRSLDPRPSSSIIDMFGALDPGPGDVVLDIGGRDGQNGLKMAERFGCRVISVDPAEANIADGKVASAEHEYGRLVEVVHGFIEEIPADDGAFDFVFSRDMFAHIADADRALAECFRVLAPGGRMLIHQVFATDRLEPIEAEQVFGHTAAVPERFSVAGFEEAAAAAGFVIENVDVVGSEWYEASQEAGTAPNYLLQVSRLRRNKEALLEEIGEVAYRVVYGNALWSINQILGKMESRVYTLRRG